MFARETHFVSMQVFLVILFVNFDFTSAIPKAASNEDETDIIDNCRCGERKPSCSITINVTDSTTRIHGGKDASPGDETWMAMVISGSGLCSGTLINDRMILTAGHCVTNRDGTLQPAFIFKVWLNRRSGFHQKPNPGSELYLVSGVYLHPNYAILRNGIIRYDAAILVLQTPVNFAKSPARPICLAEADAELPGQSALAFGYGRTDKETHPNDYELAKNLQQGNVTFKSIDKCVENFNKVAKLAGFSLKLTMDDVTSYICSSGYSKNKVTFVFNGDSGGPVTSPFQPDCHKSQQIFQRGISAAGTMGIIPKAQQADPSITYKDAVVLYTDIDEIVPFIAAVADLKDAKWCGR